MAFQNEVKHIEVSDQEHERNKSSSFSFKLGLLYCPGNVQAYELYSETNQWCKAVKPRFELSPAFALLTLEMAWVGKRLYP